MHRTAVLAAILLAGCGGRPAPAVAPEPLPAAVPVPIPVPRAEPVPAPPPPDPVAPPPVPSPAPEPVPSVLPPAALDERGLLEAWRDRVRASRTGAERDLALAASWLLEGQSLKAHDLLKGIEPALLPSEDARTAWRTYLALAASRLGDLDRAHDLLEASASAIRPLSALRISGPCFSSSAASRVPVEKAAFRPGQMVTVCLDVERLGLSLQPGGGARTKLRFDLTLLEPSGRVVSDFADWEKERGALEESSHRPWEDHAYRLTFPLPRGANVGEYLLKAEVTDLSGPAPRRASTTLPLALR